MVPASEGMAGAQSFHWGGERKSDGECQLDVQGKASKRGDDDDDDDGDDGDDCDDVARRNKTHLVAENATEADLEHLRHVISLNERARVSRRA